MKMRKLVFLSLLAFAFGACSSEDDSGDDDSDSTATLTESCHDNCDAQAAVVNCMQNVEPELCNALCDSTARDQPDECDGPYKAYYDCTVAVGFECSASYVSQKTTACDDLARALGSCQYGDMPCAGSDETGTCPGVECPCPSGTTRISGGTYESGSCVCVDTTTCLGLC